MRPECSARCPRLPANPRLLVWARKLPQECSRQIIAPKDSAPNNRSPLPGAPSPLTLRGARQAFEMAVLRGLPRTARAALAWAQCVQLGVPRASHPLLSLARTPACPQPAASGSRLRVSGFQSPAAAPATVPPRVSPCKPSAWLWRDGRLSAATRAGGGQVGAVGGRRRPGARARSPAAPRRVARADRSGEGTGRGRNAGGRGRRGRGGGGARAGPAVPARCAAGPHARSGPAPRSLCAQL